MTHRPEHTQVVPNFIFNVRTSVWALLAWFTISPMFRSCIFYSFYPRQLHECGFMGIHFIGVGSRGAVAPLDFWFNGKQVWSEIKTKLPVFFFVWVIIVARAPNSNHLPTPMHFKFPCNHTPTHLTTQHSVTVNFASTYPGNLWLVRLGILHCRLWPVQTVNFPGSQVK